MEQQKVVKRPSTFPLFSKYLTLKPQAVVNFTNECRKHFQDFCEAIKKRINIQHQYGKNLQNCSKMLDKYIQPGTEKTISYICSAFRVEHQQRAHQAHELAQSLRTEIYEICQNQLKQQAIFNKRIEKDVKKYIKEYQSLDSNLYKTLQDYQAVSKDTEQLIITKNLLKYTSQIPQQKKLKLITKTMEGIKQKKQYEKLYSSAAKNYNEFVRLYNKAITEDLNQTENHIRDQVLLQADCLRKLIVCEVSMFKNIQYDLINISKQMQVIDTQKDVQIFVEQNIASLQHLITIAPGNVANITTTNPQQKRKSTTSDISSTVSEQDTIKVLKQKQSLIDKALLSITLRKIQQEEFSSIMANKKNKAFKSLIDNRWKMLNQNIIEPKNQIQVKKQQKNQMKIQQKQDDPNQPLKKIQQQLAKKQQQNSQKLQGITKQSVQQSIILQEKENEGVSSIRQEFEQYFVKSMFKDMITEKCTTQNIFQNFILMTNYISQVWNGKQITMILKKDKKQTQSPFLKVKKLFGQHHFYRIVGYTFIQYFRIHHRVMIKSPDEAREIGKVVAALLTKSNKADDVFILRGILGLLFTYYWIQNNNKRLLYAQISVYKNSVWKKQQFWDSAIFQTTYEEMMNFGSQQGQTLGQTVLRQKNLLFSQLASYCHYMIMLGINSKSVRQIVGRYCRLYEMTEQQNKDLSKMITNTVKQYKEIVSNLIKDKDNKSDEG